MVEQWEYLVARIYEWTAKRGQNAWDEKDYYMVEELTPDGEYGLGNDSDLALPVALKSYGTQGWELVGMNLGLLIFKRHKP